MWGSPGTLIAARHMLDWTQDARWREAWDESAMALLARRDSDGLWTQQLYGHTDRVLGPVHGLVGNVLALGRGLDRASASCSSPEVQRRARAYSRRRERPRQLAAHDERGARAQDGSHPRPVVPRGTRSRRRRRPTTSTRSSSSPAPSSRGAPGLTAMRGARRSATGRPATATRSSRRSRGRATSAGSSAPAGSPFMPWRRCAGSGRAAAGVGTRCGRATSAWRSTLPIASMREPRTRCSTPD